MEYPAEILFTSHREYDKAKHSLQLLYYAYWQEQLESGKALQYRLWDADEWYDEEDDYVHTYHHQYRFKREPKMIPLDANDQLVGTVLTRKLHKMPRMLIIKQYSSCVCYIDYDDSIKTITYEELQERYIRLDGSRFEKEQE